MKHHRPSAQAHRSGTDTGRKDVRVSPLAARIRKNDYQQDTHSLCLLCKEPFQECPHSIGQVESVIALVQADDLRGKWEV